MTVRNFTPHPIRVWNGDSIVATYMPVARPPRKPPIVEETSKTINGIPVAIVTPQPSVLPAPEKGVVLIVSLPERMMNPDRTDLVSPHDYVRDEEGSIIGCRAFGMNDFKQIQKDSITKKF